MTPEALDRYLDEFYLLERQSNQRAQQFIEHSDQHIRALSQQEDHVKALLKEQSSLVGQAERYLGQTQSLYEKLLQWQGWLSGLFIVGFLSLFLWWWHIDTLSDELTELKAYLADVARLVPDVVTKGNAVYVRVAPDTKLVALQDEEGRWLEGSYVRVHRVIDSHQ